MNDARSFQKIVGIAALLVTLFIIGNVLTLFASVNNNPGVFSDAALLLPMGPDTARLFHVSMVLDLLAYVLFGPVVMFCFMWLRPRAEGRASLITFCGLAYSLLGSLGAVILDAVLPRMLADYSAAAPAQQQTMQVLARYFYLAVAQGIWNPLEVSMISVWFLGIGLLLRHELQALGMLAVVVGGLGLLDPLGWMLRNTVIQNIGAVGNVLIPVWSAWFGIHLLRSTALIASVEGPRNAGQSEALA